MKQKIKRIASNPLISGTVFIFSGGIIGNLFNFFFNLLISRNLSVDDYGTIISLISIIMLAAIPVSAIIPTIVAVSGAYFAKGDKAGLKALYFKILKPLFFGSIVFFIVTTVLLSQISSFLHIQNSALLFFSIVTIVIGYLGSVNFGFLQGKLAFKTISIGNAISSAVKLSLGFILLKLGGGIEGAMAAFLIASIVPIGIGFYILRDVFIAKIENLPKISFRDLFAYGIPSSIAIFSLNSFISTDIILVKHFFSAEQAGLYAGLSLVGKVVYYVTAPIATVMFPTIIQRYNIGQSYMKVFLLSLGLVLCASLSIGIFYQLFPSFVILFFLKNTQYLAVAPLVGLFAIFIGLFSLVSILVYFFLSINKTKIFLFVVAGAILQVLLIVLFHSSFTVVIIDSIITQSLLLSVLLLYYFIIRKNKDAKQ